MRISTAWILRSGGSKDLKSRDLRGIGRFVQVPGRLDRSDECRYRSWDLTRIQNMFYFDHGP